MGQMADDLCDGLCCLECNSYFLKAHGYPVLCLDCHREGINEGMGCSIHSEICDATEEELEKAGWKKVNDGKE